MLFRLAHLSDAHIGPLPPASLRDLAGKRLTGYVNWHRSRARLHDMAMLGRIVADIAAHSPDHIAMTGDILNLGLPSEFVPATRWLKTLGKPETVSFVPGNHDAYTKTIMPLLAESFMPWMLGDGMEAVPSLREAFPYLRQRNGVALIGLSSGIPTAPFLASGALGQEQRSQFAIMLRNCARRGLVRIVIIHHPPHRAGATPGRGLRDARAFEEIIASEGAELVIHGHNHRFSHASLNGPDGQQVPVVGVASASAVPGTGGHRAAWNLYEIDMASPVNPNIQCTIRGVSVDSGRISTLQRFAIQSP